MGLARRWLYVGVDQQLLLEGMELCHRLQTDETTCRQVTCDDVLDAEIHGLHAYGHGKFTLGRPTVPPRLLPKSSLKRSSTNRNSWASTRQAGQSCLPTKKSRGALLSNKLDLLLR